jgi:hypothetical protein
VKCADDESWNNVDIRAAEIWNWGRESKAVSPVAPWIYFRGDPGPSTPTKRPWNLPIHEALIIHLRFALYGKRFDGEHHRSKVYEQLKSNSNGFMYLLILQPDAGAEKLFQSGRPISHVFKDIIDCIDFLRRKAKENPPKDSRSENTLRDAAEENIGSKEQQKKEFSDQQQTYWKNMLGT